MATTPNPFMGGWDSSEDLSTLDHSRHAGGSTGPLLFPAGIANTSTMTTFSGESSASLVDPMLDDVATERRLLRRSQKALDPILVPESNDIRLLRSPGMSSSALTDSFPLPPPRTPITSSSSPSATSSPNLGSPVRSHEGTFGPCGLPRSTSAAGTRSLASQSNSHGNSQAAYHRDSASAASTLASGLRSPVVHLSVPPPSPDASSFQRYSGGYWQADISSLREGDAPPHLQQSHRSRDRLSAAPSFVDQRRTSRISNSDSSNGVLSPAITQAYRATPSQQFADSGRIHSFVGEISSTPLHSPATSALAYPTAAYSPNSAQTRNPSSLTSGSPRSHSRDAPPSLPRQLSYGDGDRDAWQHRQYHRNRPSSATTQSTTSSSAPSLGVDGALNTLEAEGFDFASPSVPGSPANGSGSGHTRSYSNETPSIASSPGHTHQLVRRGNILEAHPARPLSSHPVDGSGAQTPNTARRLARASLVSSQLLRSASSMDALQAVLREQPADARPRPKSAVDLQRNTEGPSYREQDQSIGSLRPPLRARYCSRYSSGPAPTLASLMDETDLLAGQEQSELDYQRDWDGSGGRGARNSVAHRHSSSSPAGSASGKRTAAWASMSALSISQKSRQSSGTHFTVASEAPSIPSLNNVRKCHEMSARESRMPTRTLAKRASRLSQLLDHTQSQPQPHKRYISAYPAPFSEDGHAESTDELDELRYSSQALKSKKTRDGISNVWKSNTSVQGARRVPADGEDAVSISTAAMTDRYEGEARDGVLQAHFRRRKSLPVSQLQTVTSGDKGGGHSKEEYEHAATPTGARNRSSFTSGASSTTVPAPLPFFTRITSSKRRKLVLLLLLLAALIIVLGAIGGTLLSKKDADSDGSGVCARICLNGGWQTDSGGSCACNCAPGYIGAFCQLDSTCVCPDGGSACEVKLARSLLAASTTAASLFTPRISPDRLAGLLNTVLPSVDGSDCSAQARLLDLPNLDPARYRQRQRWIQAVLLWDLAASEDVGNSTLRDFQSGLNYWRWQDAASFEPQPSFQAAAHGYIIDFAYEQIFAPPMSVEDAKLSATQIGRMENATAVAFGKLLSHATAASTQRSTALFNRLTSLGYGSEELVTLRQNVLASPVMFAFDAAAQSGPGSIMEQAIAAATAGTTFPRPVACQESLSAAQVDEIVRLEDGILGLNVTGSSTASCIGRPLYGTLDVLGLRLPFLEADLARQAVVVANADIKRRMTLHAGSLLSGLPFEASANTSGATTDTFGTYEHLDAVLLNYLEQIPSPTLATSLINHILQNADAPATFAGVDTLPRLEVQLWGALPFSDVDYIVSALVLPSGNTLFGSETGAAIRSWAHSSSSMSKPIRWTQTATSLEYTIDSGSDARFQQVWDIAGSLSESAIHSALADNGLLST